ncbi:MAG: succinate dehydrogenase / fumarate reductase, iron-sulfur subunit, partial [Solirubrobacteraceae bacterium]|nr:succinate dehydrogenase / fumarate reductase, iron-sulfur subunit [Solirubrobacteraceae bacterium]
RERLQDLAEDRHGIYDCTHCFKCIDACPKGVAPMSQIMRLRRRAGSDFHIEDPNNGERHERSFVSLVRQYGLLNEAELVPRSYGGDSPLAKFKPVAARVLASSLPTIARALLRRKVTPTSALRPHRLPKSDLRAIDHIYDEVEGRGERFELNLYISGRDEDIQ